jgi:hypothetical protein
MKRFDILILRDGKLVSVAEECLKPERAERWVLGFNSLNAGTNVTAIAEPHPVSRAMRLASSLSRSAYT